MLCYVLKSNKPGGEVVCWRERESDKNEEYIHENPFYASASPLRSARSARTSSFSVLRAISLRSSLRLGWRCLGEHKGLSRGFVKEGDREKAW